MSPSFMTYSLPSLRTETLGLCACQRAALLQIVKGDDLGADEAALEIRVDLSGRLRRLRALF